MTSFKAQARVTLHHPSLAIEILCRHFAEEDLETSWSDQQGAVSMSFGWGRLSAESSHLTLTALADDLSGLHRMKNHLAGHLEDLLVDEKPDVVWTGDGCGDTTLPSLRIMTVIRAEAVTPLVRRVTLCGDDLGRFADGGLHVKLLVPQEDASEPAWPTLGRNGRPAWPPPALRPQMRTYTMRRLNVAAGEMDIDFVLHGDDGVASRWAARAGAGDIVGVMGPGGMSPRDAAWLLLAGDATAIPCFARLLERLPADAHAVVRIAIAGPEEEQDLPSAASVDLRYLHGAAEGLEPAVRDVVLPPEGTRFVYIGTEAGIARRLRAYLRDDCGLHRTEHLSVAYWRHGFREGEAGSDD